MVFKIQQEVWDIQSHNNDAKNEGTPAITSPPTFPPSAYSEDVPQEMPPDEQMVYSYAFQVNNIIQGVTMIRVSKIFGGQAGVIFMICLFAWISCLARAIRLRDVVRRYENPRGTG